MTPHNQYRYRIAGTLAMINALLTIPWLIMTFFLGIKEGMWFKIAEITMQLSSTCIFVFTSLTLKRLVNLVHAFHGVDRYILLLIKGNVVLMAVSCIGAIIPAVASAAGIIAVILVVPPGVIQLLFGIKLLQLPADLDGLLRPYCYLNMITGFSLAAIILLPLGILTGAIADIMLGTIFFQAAGSGRLIDTKA